MGKGGEKKGIVALFVGNTGKGVSILGYPGLSPQTIRSCYYDH